MDLIMAVEIYSLRGLGKLRVAYDWWDSSLICDPQQQDEFVWNLYRIDEHRYALSPRDNYQGYPLYTSVRDDKEYFLQVQVPFSTNWITHVYRDEELGFELKDLNLALFKGFNDRYIGLNDTPDYEQTTRPPTRLLIISGGYRLRSIYEAPTKSCFWYLKPVHDSPVPNRMSETIFAPGLSFESVLGEHGVSLTADEMAAFTAQIA
ncbi:MAG: hypothetical protein IT260_07550 [Saprospiraceae bacterium]|nr:hypothetical protein [Saprospiraceae bacterium]